MKAIKFSHRYKKMPKNLYQTHIYAVEVTDFDKLTPEFIDQDTETVDGKFYPLPTFGKCMIIRLWTNGHKWQTVRSWNPEKEKYYKSLIGQEVRILIANNGTQKTNIRS